MLRITARPFLRKMKLVRMQLTPFSKLAGTEIKSNPEELQIQQNKKNQADIIQAGLDAILEDTINAHFEQENQLLALKKHITTSVKN